MGASIDPGHSEPDQPGLEVAQEYSGIEVVTAEHHPENYPEYSQQPIYTPLNKSEDSELADVKSATQGRRRRRRRLIWIIVGVVAAVLVIVGAVVGGVVGSESNKTSAPKETSSSNTDETPEDQRLRNGTGLAVTGRRVGKEDYETYLYYQGADGQIRQLVFNSTKSDKWEAPTVVATNGANGTGMAASTILDGSGDDPQMELFFHDANSALLGRSINYKSANTNEDDSIRGEDIKTIKSSYFAAYWPWIMYQGEDAQLVSVIYKPGWQTSQTSVFADEGTRLAMVPTSTNYTEIASPGGYAAFLRGTGGSLTAFIDSESSSKSPWAAENFPSPQMAEDSPVAAVAVARAGSKNSQVDTYVIFKSSSGKFTVLSNESTDVWKSSTPSVFQKADDDSDMTCWTMATSAKDAEGKAVPLEEASKETRCYFVEGGDIQEVVLDGGKWDLVGTVPLGN